MIAQYLFEVAGRTHKMHCTIGAIEEIALINPKVFELFLALHTVDVRLDEVRAGCRGWDRSWQ